MNTRIKFIEDKFDRSLWYIKADNGMITNISEKFLENDPTSLVAFDISPVAAKEKEDDSADKAKKKEEPDILLQFLKDLGGAAIVLAIPLYIGGWTYLQAYYKGFGLRMTELGFSLYDVLVYSIPLLTYTWWVTLGLVALLLGLGAAFSTEYVQKKPAPLKTVFFIILYFLLIFGVSSLGARMGRENASRDLQAATTTLPFVAVEVDPEKVKYDVAKYLEYNRLNYVLLLNKNGQYFLFAPVKKMDEQDTNIQQKSFEISVIPSNLVNLVRIQRGVAPEQ